MVACSIKSISVEQRMSVTHHQASSSAGKSLARRASFWGGLRVFGLRSLLLVALAVPGGRLGAADRILNASYDVSREFYRDYNAHFVRHWQETAGREVRIDMSHAGSGRQARAVIDGLAADVVTMNQVLDINAIARIGGQVPADWRTRLPHRSAPYSSTILFLVRKGNPKNIRDWEDLAKPGIGVILPNPKTSGNGRYSYLAAYAHALKNGGGDHAKAREFITRLFANVPVLDTGGRGATTTFAQRGIGDVLLTFESEAHLAVQELGADKFEVVAPVRSIEAEAPVAVVDRVVDRRGTRAVAEAYLRELFSESAQEIAARHYFRPRHPEVARRHAGRFAELELLSVDEWFGGWDEAQRVHFDDGGLFDKIYQPGS